MATKDKIAEIELWKKAKGLHNIAKETMLLPHIIADKFSRETIAKKNKKELDNWSNLSKKEQKELDSRFEKEVKDIEDYLVGRAETLFLNNKQFKENVKGADGREYLYTFMEHWSVAYMKFLFPSFV